jgi:hypothetical protein
MTFREALMAADLDKVYALICKRDRGNAAACDRPTLAQTVFNYSRVVKELMGKPRVKAYSKPILVETRKDPFDKKPYIDVCLLNPRYVKPPKGAKPWGGTRGQKVPKGKYNCNADKYNRCFSLMGIPWSKLIDTDIRIETKCTLEEAVSRLLWELTFDGWTEEKCVEKTAFIMDRIKEAEDDIKKGNCITLPPKKKGGMKIVIPDAVSKQIMDIINKPCSKAINAKKCGTCWGNGLWPDGTAPMGPMDASDGMPTIPCPECGANPNPIKKK